YNHSAPALHKSIGLTLLGLMIVRLLWRFISPAPATLNSYSRATRLGAKLGHGALYLLLFAVLIAGYLISTADGRPIEVFGLFAVPATLTSIPDQEDLAGAVHLYLA
ncbi:cytochrome b, partial [Pseudomonas viridiflava]|uniref:cytochrome b n=1 Tax=Pseudomonas viridiflava TaxID=33069 RepID=UPI0013CE8B92